jgi:hypothetical protein
MMDLLNHTGIGYLLNVNCDIECLPKQAQFLVILTDLRSLDTLTIIKLELLDFCFDVLMS